MNSREFEIRKVVNISGAVVLRDDCKYILKMLDNERLLVKKLSDPLGNVSVARFQSTIHDLEERLAKCVAELSLLKKSGKAECTDDIQPILNKALKEDSDANEDFVDAIP